MTFGFEFTSGRSHYRKMIDSTGRDYMYWNDLCEGEFFIQSIYIKNNLVVSGMVYNKIYC